MILETTIGREKEIESLFHNATHNHHTLLHGRSGVGKTHLLLDLQRRLRKHAPPSPPTPPAASTATTPPPPPPTAVHYLRRPVPAKETIESIYGWLCLTASTSRPRTVSDRTRIADLNQMIAEVLALPQLQHRRIVLLLDELDQLPVLAVPVLEVLAERVTLIAAARTRSRAPRFQRLFWRFQELPVRPLTPQESRTLADHVIAQVPAVQSLPPSTREFLLTQVSTLSNGVPSAIVESADRLLTAPSIDHDFIRKLFAHRSGNSYFDAAPLILTFFVFLIVMRYINRGMYQFDMYAIFGALSGTMLLARWFMMRTARANS